MDDMIGKKIGPYEIIAEAGRGGMATVYRARQPSMDREVAIKMIHSHFARNPSQIQRFQREARLVARLEHPHILPVYDFDGAHDPPYIVMRYLEGGSLSNWLAGDLLPHSEVIYLMAQICPALDYIHRQGIVHRDIKPSNIMIDREENVFLTDLGIARIIAQAGSEQLTQAGASMGTPDYMSPEQVLGKEDIDYRADLYSLGIMLFQMLTGELPYKSTTPMGVLIMHLQQPLPSASERNPALPPAVDSVLSKAMAKEREDRYQSASALNADLMATLGQTAAYQDHSGWVSNGLMSMARTGSADQAIQKEQNKQVVALYVDAAEFAEIVEAKRGSQSAHRAIISLWSACEGDIESYGGKVFMQTENELLALWGSDVTREDDAERAIRAALAIQGTLRSLANKLKITPELLEAADERLPLNIGIHSGLALLSLKDEVGAYAASGGTINLANRLRQNADGRVLISHDVFRQTAGVFDMVPAESIRARGRKDPLDTYRVIGARLRAFRIRGRGLEGVETRLIGRTAELERMQKAYFIAMVDGKTQVVTIDGEAGVGKSRLISEFDLWSELRPEKFFYFKGQGTYSLVERPYALIRNMILERFAILEDDYPTAVMQKLEAGIGETIGRNDEMAHLIGHLCGFDLKDSPYIRSKLDDPQRLALQARQIFIRYFVALAKIDRVIIQLDDIHNSDGASLELLNELFASDPGLYLLVICATRPRLFDQHPGWGSGQAYHIRIDLKPLDQRDSHGLARELLQKIPNAPRRLRDILVERAEGNPYYMEELVKMLIDDHVIARESEDAWRVEESRLDAFAAFFSANLPATLSGLLEARLDTLLYPEKLTLQRAAAFGRTFYDAAVEAMDKADEVHITETADVLNALVKRGFIYRNESSAFADCVEYTFSQALLRDVIYNSLLEGALCTYHRAIADWLASRERANEYLPLIAEHYEKAGAYREAERALHLAGEQARLHGLFREAEAYFEQAMAHLAEIQTAATGDDETDKLNLLLQLGETAVFSGNLPKAQPSLVEALALARRQDNTVAQARALSELGGLENDLGYSTEALAHMKAALGLARKSDDTRTLANILIKSSLVYTDAYNSLEARGAAQECVTLAQALGDDLLLVQAKNELGAIYTQEGAYPAARAQLEAALGLAQRIGHNFMELRILNNLGYLAIHEQNWPEAIRYLEKALPTTRENGDNILVAAMAGNLAMAYLRSGAPAQAQPLAHEALQVARQMESTPWMLAGIGVMGELKLAIGDVTGGLALLGLVKHHPSLPADAWRDVASGLAFWQAQLNLTQEQIEAGLAAGKSLDLEDIY